VTPRRKVGSWFAQNSKNDDDKPLFLLDPGSEGKQPEEFTGKQTSRRRPSEASVAWVVLEQDGEEEEVEEEEEAEMTASPTPKRRRVLSVMKRSVLSAKRRTRLIR